MRKFEVNKKFCCGAYRVVKITEKSVFFKAWDAIKEEWTVVRRKKHVQCALDGTACYEYAIIHRETGFTLKSINAHI